MARSEHIATHQDKLLRATTMRKASRYLAKRSAEIKECRTEGRDYSGSTVWRISQMQKNWYRTAQQRANLETRPETRRLVESSRKFGRMRKPDERLADEEHMKVYRKNGEGWRPPAPKPAYHRRRYPDRSACNKRRRQRKKVSQRLNPHSRPLAITEGPFPLQLQLQEDIHITPSTTQPCVEDPTSAPS